MENSIIKISRISKIAIYLLFTGYFLDQYTESSGLTYSVKADATLPNVPSANLCAKLCSQYTAFQCKSFEYCTSTKNCLLLKIHELEMVGNTASPSLTCSFYSSEYMYIRKEINLRFHFFPLFKKKQTHGRTCLTILFFNIFLLLFFRKLFLWLQVVEKDDNIVYKRSGIFEYHQFPMRQTVCGTGRSSLQKLRILQYDVIV